MAKASSLAMALVVAPCMHIALAMHGLAFLRVVSIVVVPLSFSILATETSSDMRPSWGRTLSKMPAGSGLAKTEATRVRKRSILVARGFPLDYHSFHNQTKI